MGKILTPIPFWATNIIVKEVIEASSLDFFDIETLDDVTTILGGGLNGASLYEVDNDTLLLRLPGNHFINFIQG